MVNFIVYVFYQKILKKKKKSKNSGLGLIKSHLKCHSLHITVKRQHTVNGISFEAGHLVSANSDHVQVTFGPQDPHL